MLILGLLSSSCKQSKPHYILINEDGHLDTVPRDVDSINMLIDSIKAQGHLRLIADSTGMHPIVDTNETD